MCTGSYTVVKPPEVDHRVVQQRLFADHVAVNPPLRKRDIAVVEGVLATRIHWAAVALFATGIVQVAGRPRVG